MNLYTSFQISTEKFIRLLLCVLFLTCTLDSLAQKGDTISYDLSLEELLNIKISTATKTAVGIEEVPAATEVITIEQILQRGYQNLGQVLNDIADNHEDRSNWGIGEPLNQNVGLGFRFDTGQNILLLFNGQRLNAFLPGNRFGGEEYLLNTIERIEIIRGPGSALYGSNAFTAVVNIISKSTINKQSGNVQMGSEYIPTSKGFASAGSVNSSFGKEGFFSGSFRYFTEAGQTLTVSNSLFGNS